MKKIAKVWGSAASKIALVFMVVYMGCFIGILFVNPLYIWDGYESYLTAARTTNQWMKHVAMASMIMYGILFVIQTNSLYEVVEGERRYFASLAKGFGFAFCLLISIHYFVQITAVRLQVAAEPAEGLVQWIQANPISGMSAINMLGWTIMYGLANFFVGLSFEHVKGNRIFRWVFFANAGMMALGAIGFFLQADPLTFFAMNVGLGGAMIFGSLLFLRFFRNSSQG